MGTERKFFISKYLLYGTLNQASASGELLWHCLCSIIPEPSEFGVRLFGLRASQLQNYMNAVSPIFFCSFLNRLSVVLSSMALLRLFVLVLVSDVCAREITFPPVAGVQHPLGNMGIDGINPMLDLSTALYSGLTTYASLPYVHCLANEGEDVGRYDIAIMGAPFDTVCICPLPLALRTIVCLMLTGTLGRYCSSWCPFRPKRHSSRFEKDLARVLVQCLYG